MFTSVMQTVRSIIRARTGVTVDSGAERLAGAVPNSMALVGVLTACEDAFDVRIDYGSLNRSTTLDQFVEIIERAGREGLGDEDGPPPAAPAVRARRPPAGTGAGGPIGIPMNPMQVAYLLGGAEGIELGGQATFVYLEALLPVGADEAAAAVRGVMDRHDVFRARLDEENARVLVEPAAAPAPIPVHAAVRGRDADGLVAGVRAGLIAEARASNEGERLYGVALVEHGDATRLCVFLNMIIVDAASVYVLLREIDDRLAGRPPAPVVPYARAARELAARRGGAVRERSLAYWAGKAPELPPAPRFKPGVTVLDGWSTRRCSAVLPRELLERIRARAGRTGVSATAALLAVHAGVLARWADRGAFSVNMTVTERAELDAGARGMGDFTSSMLIGIDTTAAGGVDAVSAAIHADTVAGLMNRGCSGVEVMSEFLRGSAPQQEALMPVVFTSFVEGAAGADHSSGLRVEHAYTQTSQVFLDMQAMPHRDSVSLSWDYVPEYFGFDVRTMFDAMIEAVAQYADGGEPLPVRDRATERRVVAYNDTAAPLPGGTLMSAVRASFAEHAARPAIVSPALGLEYSYAQVEEISARLAGLLVDRGCRPGDVVMIESTKHPMSIINQLAVLRAGASFVPVSAAHPAERRAYIARASGAIGLVLADDSYDELGAASYPGAFRDVEVDPGALAYVIFTSGSTGRPKGVEITHAGAVNTINDINTRFGVGPEDVIIGLSALSFDLSVYDIYGALGAGALLAVVDDERDADEIHAVLGRCGVTVWSSTPALVELALLRAEAGTRYPGLRLLMMSGDRIAADLPGRARTIFPNADINSLGGATEGSIWSIHYRFDGDRDPGTIPYGYPLANQRMYVMGFDGRPCPVGVPGEICIAGAGVALGYRGEKDRTDAVFVDTEDYGRIYRTGDIGVFNEHGFIDFLGRRDRQVKVRGHRIELGEIEAVLSEADGTRLVLAAVLDHLGRDALVAFVVPERPGAGVEAARYTALARRKLPEYMVPQHVIGLDEVPVNGHGKVDRPALQRLLEERIGAAGRAPAPPSGSFRGPLRELWEDVLKGPVTSDDASFFELGGDSLKFQEMLRRVRRASGRALRFRDVIVEPTLARVGELLERARPVGDAAGPVDEAPGEQGGDFDPFPLTDMQLAYLVGRSEAFALGGVAEHYYVESENELDMARLEDAFNALIARHPMLHAVIGDDGTQRIMERAPRYRIEVTDLSGADDRTVERAIAERRALLSHERFAPGTWPQYSLSAIDLGRGRYRLFLSIDMLLADGASQRIILEDLTRLYEGREPLPLGGRFRDYVMRLRAGRGSAFGQLTGPQVDGIVDGFPVGNVLPELPGARMDAAPSVRRLSQLIGAEQAAALREQARAHGVSISSLFAAAYVGSLGLWAAGGRVGINVTTYNRDRRIADTGNVVGDFTGVVLLSYDATGRPDLFGTARRVQHDLLEHLDAGYSGVRMISEIARRRHAVGQAIAPFVLTSLLFDADQPELPGRDASVLGRIHHALSQTPQVLLDNQLVPMGGQIAVSWDYVESFFDATMMTELFEHYLATLRRCAAGRADPPPVPAGSAVMVKRALLSRMGGRAERPAARPAEDGRAEQEDAGEVLAIAREQLRMPALAAPENLFDAGVDSLGFIALVKEIESRTGVRIPLASALSDPSAARLARLVRAAPEPREPAGRAGGGESLVWLAPGGRTKAVLVHGGFGTVEVYRDLAMALPADWDVWGLRFGALARPWPQHLGVEEIAGRYADGIRARFGPGSRIVLVGWSIGGTLAAELAGLLAHEYRVDAVLLDSLAPGPQVDVGGFDPDAERELLARVLPAELAGRLDGAAGTEQLWRTVGELVPGRPEQAVLVRALAGSISETLMEDLGAGGAPPDIEQFNTLRTLIAARNAYRPRHRLERLTALHATDGEAFNCTQWGALAPDGFRAGELEGNHYSILMGTGAEATAETVARFAAVPRPADGREAGR